MTFALISGEGNNETKVRRHRDAERPRVGGPSTVDSPPSVRAWRPSRSVTGFREDRARRGRNTRQANKAHLDGYIARAARSFATEMMLKKGDDFVEPAVNSGFKAGLAHD